MPQMSNRIHLFTDSVIRRMTRISDACGAINLSQGFPDFPPPKALTDTLKTIADDGPHQYSVTYGADNLREAGSGNLRQHGSHDVRYDDRLQSGRQGCNFFAIL